MTRVELLTMELADGEISDQEHEELLALIASDAEARRRHFAMMRLESTLAGGRRAIGAAAAVRAALEREARPRRTTPRRRAWAGALAAALGAIAVAWAVGRPRNRTASEHATTPPLSGETQGAAAIRRIETGRTPSVPAAPRLGGRAEAAASALAPGAARTERDRTVLAAFDFESGVLPDVFNRGVLTSENCPEGSRHCVVGEINTGTSDVTLVTISTSVNGGRGRVLYAYSPTAVLSFDYWLGEDARRVNVQIRSGSVGYAFSLREVTHERWTRALVRLAEFRPYDKRARALEPGDGIRQIELEGGRRGGKPFYVDNIELVDYRSEALVPPSSSGNKWGP